MARQREVRRHEVKMTRSDDIAQRAFELFLARGGEPGHDLDDWLQAERELKRSSPSVAPQRVRMPRGADQ